MKTAIICTMWLNGDYIPKTHKFLDYYLDENVQKELGNPDIWMVDNASNTNEIRHLAFKYLKQDKLFVQSYEKHYDRTAHLEYPYCWRALYFARDLFQENDYDKVIFMNNDSFIISKEMMNFVRDFKSGYWVPWCNKHRFPECEIQVITKDHEGYWQMTATPYLKQNGKQMENVIPAVSETIFKGDRWAEYDGLSGIPEEADYSTQTPLGWKVNYDGL